MKDFDPNLRFWGFEPASAEDAHNGYLPTEERRAIRDKLKADKEAIKAAGLKPSAMGYRAKIAAIGAASRVEKATGIKMRIFQHDYL